jgi:hypothetical protein
MDQSRVTRMRALLLEAGNVSPDAAFRGFLSMPGGIRGPLKRRAMIKQVQLAAKHYDMQLEIEAYLAEADCASLAGLSDRQLHTLANWTASVIECLAVVADYAGAPVAR